jgi:hypothetical protein
MDYLLLLYSNENGWSSMTKEQQQQGYAAYMAYTEALKKAGAYKASQRLQPIATATTVRVADGKSQVLDGPYVDSKEQLGGFYLIEAPDLDSALAWAARCPGAGHGTIEVRPIWSMDANTDQTYGPPKTK